MVLGDELTGIIEGEVLSDDASRKAYSRDASLFEVTPEVVVLPKNVQDVKRVVRLVSQQKSSSPSLSVTGRSAGTDMTGGPLTESIVLDFIKYFNHIKEVGKSLNLNGTDADGYAVVEPGVFYRDFEKATLAQGFLLPSYPASREICAMGGIVNNNSGGEKSLVYGKTQDYVTKLRVVLSDGEEHELKPLTIKELEEKERLTNFEGEIYSSMHDLLEKNYNVVQRARPRVSKNSSGYNLWDVWNRKTFDLTKLFVGSQGTLGITTEATFRLVRTKPRSGMLVVFLEDLTNLVEIIHAVLPLKPTSFESFDDHTLRLALKFFTGFLKLLGARNLFALGFRFLPEFLMVVRGGLPKLVLLIEFEEDSQEEVHRKIGELEKKLTPFNLRMRRAETKEEAKKYWAIRRESFNLLRHKVKNMQTAPFIDDFVVDPEKLPEFLPKLYVLLDKYKLLYTIAGHVGNGNFHIIPLMTLANESDRAKIKPAADEVFDLILKYDGSLTGEHNDGLIRSPYLRKAYGDEVYALFEEVKHIFDPQNIFNPGKKVGADLEYALQHLKRS